MIMRSCSAYTDCCCNECALLVIPNIVKEIVSILPPSLPCPVSKPTMRKCWKWNSYKFGKKQVHYWYVKILTAFSIFPNKFMWKVWEWENRPFLSRIKNTFLQSSVVPVCPDFFRKWESSFIFHKKSNLCLSSHQVLCVLNCLNLKQVSCFSTLLQRQVYYRTVSFIVVHLCWNL